MHRIAPHNKELAQNLIVLRFRNSELKGKVSSHTVKDANVIRKVFVTRSDLFFTYARIHSTLIS